MGVEIAIQAEDNRDSHSKQPWARDRFVLFTSLEVRLKKYCKCWARSKCFYRGNSVVEKKESHLKSG